MRNKNNIELQGNMTSDPQVLQINVEKILESRPLYFNNNFLSLQPCTVNLTCKWIIQCSDKSSLLIWTVSEEKTTKQTKRNCHQITIRNCRNEVRSTKTSSSYWFIVKPIKDFIHRSSKLFFHNWYSSFWWERRNLILKVNVIQLSIKNHPVNKDGRLLV